jgi:hypothetical protein
MINSEIVAEKTESCIEEIMALQFDKNRELVLLNRKLANLRRSKKMDSDRYILSEMKTKLQSDFDATFAKICEKHNKPVKFIKKVFDVN